MNETSSRGATWLAALTDNLAPVAGYPASVRVVDAPLADQPCRYIAVLPDASNPTPACSHPARWV
jgi:malonate decarboxylase gamma subunit